MTRHRPPNLTITRHVRSDLTIQRFGDGGSAIRAGSTTLYLDLTDTLAASDALLGLPDHRLVDNAYEVGITEKP